MTSRMSDNTVATFSFYIQAMAAPCDCDLTCLHSVDALCLFQINKSVTRWHQLVTEATKMWSEAEPTTIPYMTENKEFQINSKTVSAAWSGHAKDNEVLRCGLFSRWLRFTRWCRKYFNREKTRLLKSFKSWQLKSRRRRRMSVCVEAVSPLYSRDQWVCL